MPCRSDYLNQNDREQRLQESAKLLVFTLKKLGKDVPDWAKKAAKDYYCKDDRSVPMLCDVLGKMTKKQESEIIYDGRDKTSRRLADWWEEHQKADKARLKKEREEKKKKKLAAAAKSKLSKEELAALGVSEND